MTRVVAKIPLFWRLQITGWGLYACMTLPLKVVLYESIAYALLVTVFRESFGFILTSALRYIYCKLGLSVDRPIRLVLFVLCIAFIGSGLDTLLGMWIEYIGGRTKSGDPIFGIFVFRALLFTVWSLLFFSIKDLLAARTRLAKLHAAESAARDAEILMLRAQVSPHFLFNAFNTILADLDERNHEMVPVVRGLSDYFRYSLANHDEVFVTLGQEYDAIMSYLTVEKARFRESLEIDCYLDPDLRNLEVPGIFLQPLIENALKFGHMSSPTPLKLCLHIKVAPDGRAIVEVSNSGKWHEPSEERRNKDIGGQGLSVLRRRLDLLYPGRHSLETLHPDDEEQVTIRIFLPFRNLAEAHHVK